MYMSGIVVQSFANGISISSFETNVDLIDSKKLFEGTENLSVLTAKELYSDDNLI